MPPPKKREPAIYNFNFKSKTIPLLLIFLFIMFKLIVPAFSMTSQQQNNKKSSPQPWTMYLAIALSQSQSPPFTRAFNKTLTNLTDTFLDTNSSYNITLNPLFIALPDHNRFSAAILEDACATFEGKHVIAVLIIGGSPAAFAVALAAGTSGIPVLWARGGGEATGYFHQEIGPLEVHFEPGSHETLNAVRSLLLAAHWHSFTVLADSSAAAGVALRRDISAILASPPLNPTLMLLQPQAPPTAIFRRLADISRSTRGVVLLLCDLSAAKRIMAEAKRLNMMSGHFVWLWVDTSATAVFNVTNENANNKNNDFLYNNNTKNEGKTNHNGLKPVGNVQKVTTNMPPVNNLKNRAKNNPNSRRPREMTKAKEELQRGVNVSRQHGTAEPNVPEKSRTGGTKAKVSSNVAAEHARAKRDVVKRQRKTTRDESRSARGVVVTSEGETPAVRDRMLYFKQPIKDNDTRHIVNVTGNSTIGANLSRAEFKGSSVIVDLNGASKSKGDEGGNAAKISKQMSISTEEKSRVVSREERVVEEYTPPSGTVTKSNRDNDPVSTRSRVANDEEVKEDRDRNRKLSTSLTDNVRTRLEANTDATKATRKTVYNKVSHENQRDVNTNDEDQHETRKYDVDEGTKVTMLDERKSEGTNVGMKRFYFRDEGDSSTKTGSTLNDMNNHNSRVVDDLSRSVVVKGEEEFSPDVLSGGDESVSISDDDVTKKGGVVVKDRKGGVGDDVVDYQNDAIGRRSEDANVLKYLATVTQDRFVVNKNNQRNNNNNENNDPKGSLLERNSLDLRGGESSRGSAYETRGGKNRKNDWLPFSSNGGQNAKLSAVSRNDENTTESLPVGLLAVKLQPMKVDRHFVKGSVRLLVDTLRIVLTQCAEFIALPGNASEYHSSCWRSRPSAMQQNFSAIFARELRGAVSDLLAGKGRGSTDSKGMMASFSILNLVPDTHNTYVEDYTREDEGNLRWRVVGGIHGRAVRLDSIVWPGGDLVVAGLSARARSVFRVVTALAPPFVMEGELDEDGQCLRGLACHRVLTSDKDNLTLVFNEMETQERLEDEEEDTMENPSTPLAARSGGSGSPYQRTDYHTFDLPNPARYKYRTSCCYGISMDLLENVAQELEFDVNLYIVSDGFFGSKVHEGPATTPTTTPATTTTTRMRTKREHTQSKTKWNGIVGDLVSGAAHMSFAALSVSSARSDVIDFSVPYFFSGVSLMAAPTQKSEIPLLAFLLPFSPELWVAIFISLNVTAMAVAVYEWLSPFGLNPWGRQRSKNFSIASALWVMWGLLCGHLVAFKAPKSWPNKFLINVWGGFSVIFVASYTANIAALIAGLFFHNNVNYHDRSLLSQRVGAPRSSSADDYIHRANPLLWEQMQRYSTIDVHEGIQHLKNGSLDILLADTPILDYYRATDHGCKLQKIGDALNEDTYAVGMAKGFPLKESISSVIAKYSTNGYMDILQHKWYGGLPCFKMDVLDMDMAQPRPLGLSAVAGVFLLLGLGMVMGILILIFEHLFYRYSLPILRHQPKGTVWRSRNIMFFSQKLYRFINCVELVSPHHAARELVHTLRQGQITSLFQKSVKRKEHEQRRRRKSKAQFFEMIQEIRRVQQEGRDQPTIIEEDPSENEPEHTNPVQKLKSHLLSPLRTRSPPRRTSPKLFGGKSPNTSDPRSVREIFTSSGSRKKKSPLAAKKRRFSTDLVFSPRKVRLDCPSTAVGRRLSKDSSGCWSNSPPDINSRRSSNLDLNVRQQNLLQKQESVSDSHVNTGGTSSNPNLLSPKVMYDTTPRLKVQVLPLSSKSSTNISSKIDEETMISCWPKPDVVEGSTAGMKKNKSENGLQSRSKSPAINIQMPSPKSRAGNMATVPKFRGRVRSDNNCKGKVKNRARLRTPSPDGRFGSNVRSRSLGDQFLYDEIKPFLEPEKKREKVKKKENNEKRKSMVEVSITCCESDESTSSGHVRKLAQDFEQRMGPTSPSGTVKRAGPKRRQSHQQRLESEVSPRANSTTRFEFDAAVTAAAAGAAAAKIAAAKISSATGKAVSKRIDGEHPKIPPKPQHIKELIVPVQRHDGTSPGGRKRHLSNPVRVEAAAATEANSSSVSDQSSLSPFTRRHRFPDSPQDSDNVFDDIPPPPPPPACNSRNGSNGNSPLERLNKEELVALWRSSETELRSHLLRAIKSKDVTDPP